MSTSWRISSSDNSRICTSTEQNQSIGCEKTYRPFYHNNARGENHLLKEGVIRMLPGQLKHHLVKAGKDCAGARFKRAGRALADLPVESGLPVCHRDGDSESESAAGHGHSAARESARDSEPTMASDPTGHRDCSGKSDRTMMIAMTRSPDPTA